MSGWLVLISVGGVLIYSLVAFLTLRGFANRLTSTQKKWHRAQSDFDIAYSANQDLARTIKQLQEQNKKERQASKYAETKYYELLSRSDLSHDDLNDELRAFQARSKDRGEGD